MLGLRRLWHVTDGVLIQRVWTLICTWKGRKRMRADTWVQTVISYMIGVFTLWKFGIGVKSSICSSSHTHSCQLLHLFFSFTCSSPALLIVSFHTHHTISPPHPLPLIPSPFLFLLPFPLCEGACFPLLCGYECCSPREAEERMYPRGLFGVQLSVDQHVPDGLTGSSSMQ